MDTMLTTIQRLVDSGKVRISEHGYDELMNDSIFVKEMISDLKNAVVVEEYPEYKKGPCILVLVRDNQNTPIHAVWGIPKGYNEPAVLVTAYRPDPEIWESDFLNRRRP